MGGQILDNRSNRPPCPRLPCSKLLLKMLPRYKIIQPGKIFSISPTEALDITVCSYYTTAALDAPSTSDIGHHCPSHVGSALGLYILSDRTSYSCLVLDTVDELCHPTRLASGISPIIARLVCDPNQQFLILRLLRQRYY